MCKEGRIEKGVKVAKKCVSCHSFDIGGANKIGPALWGIVDRDIAASTGFDRRVRTRDALLDHFLEHHEHWPWQRLWARVVELLLQPDHGTAVLRGG